MTQTEYDSFLAQQKAEQEEKTYKAWLDLQQLRDNLFKGKTFKVGNTSKTSDELWGNRYISFASYMNASDISKVVDTLNKNKDVYILIFPNTFRVFQNIPNEGMLIRTESYNNEDGIFFIHDVQGVDKDYINQP